MGTNISVIICTHNRSEILKKCLERIYQQTVFTNSYEVIVVDNNSQDNTKDVVAIYKDKNIKYLFEKRQGLSYARNTGAQHATNQWITYLDDDGLAHPNFIAEALNTIANYDFDCFGGVYYPWFKFKRPRWMREDYGTKIHLATKITEIFSPLLDGGIFAIKREVLFKVGGFPQNLGMSGRKIAYGEETLLQQKLIDANFKLGFNPYWSMDHLVGKHKLNLYWHLKAEYAKGRDMMAVTNKPIKNWSYIDIIKFISYQTLSGLKRNSKKLSQENYYIENLILDVLKPIYFRFGQQSKRNA